MCGKREVSIRDKKQEKQLWQLTFSSQARDSAGGTGRRHSDELHHFCLVHSSRHAVNQQAPELCVCSPQNSRGLPQNFCLLFVVSIALQLFLPAVSTLSHPMPLSQCNSSEGKESACNAGDLSSITDLGEDPLKKGMATRSSILAWRIPWAEEPGGLQSMGWQS